MFESFRQASVTSDGTGIPCVPGEQAPQALVAEIERLFEPELRQ
jgi:hypothetical protein